METTTFRLQYTKQGNMKFISHLDINRLFLRALRRAGLKPKYSEGFHPHPKLSFALPLGLGHESVCELADISLAEASEPEEVKNRLNAVLPEGCRIVACALPGGAFKTAAMAGYTLTVPVKDETAFPLIREALTGQVIVERRTKSKTERCDISTMMDKISFEEKSGCMEIRVRLSVAPNAYLNPNCLYDALKEQAGLSALLDGFYVTRTAIYDKNGLLLSPMA